MDSHRRYIYDWCSICVGQVDSDKRWYEFSSVKEEYKALLKYIISIVGLHKCKKTLSMLNGVNYPTRPLRFATFVHLFFPVRSQKLQSTGPLIYISLNHKSAYCVILRSSKDFDTCVLVIAPVTRPYCPFTCVYEGHFMLCSKEELKVELSDRVMANF